MASLGPTGNCYADTGIVIFCLSPISLFYQCSFRQIQIKNQTKPNQSESPASKTWDSLVVQMVMNPPVNAGDSGSIPGSIPWRRKWQPTSVFLPGESHGQRSLVGYRPWCCKELDTTERLTLSKPQPSDCFREEGPGVCRMRWPERKQAGTQGCWGCWPALLLSPCGQR